MVRKAPPPSPPSVQSAAERPSKSQRKRDMTALQDLGESLLRLTPAELARVRLPEALREAIGATARIGSHEARRRHLQYIGKLMRQVDPEPLRAAIELRKMMLPEPLSIMRGATACVINQALFTLRFMTRS